VLLSVELHNVDDQEAKGLDEMIYQQILLPSWSKQVKKTFPFVGRNAPGRKASWLLVGIQTNPGFLPPIIRKSHRISAQFHAAAQQFHYFAN
jgi:hypothetical protein